jgi:hypothetical protein
MIWVSALALGTAAMAGCSEARPAAQAKPVIEAAQTPTAAATAATPAVAATPTAATTPSAAPSAREPAPRKVSLDAKLTVKRLVVAQGVKNHEPVEPGTTFKSDARKIYAYVEVENLGRDPGEIVVEFEPPGGGAPHGDVTLAVGPSPRWRTWAYTRNAHTAGSWTAVVKSRRGEVLARAPFEVTL